MDMNKCKGIHFHKTRKRKNDKIIMELLILSRKLNKLLFSSLFQPHQGNKYSVIVDYKFQI